MKKLFYLGLAGILLFEFLNVYFIMPLPGSQQFENIGISYFLYSKRWVFRVFLLAMTLRGTISAFSDRRKWLPLIPLFLAIGVVYLFNFKMTAEKMFLQPKQIIFLSESENSIHGDRLVIGIENNGEAKAYPISFLSYHHQIIDSVGGHPVMVTYTVCRTGRVWEPLVEGEYEKFRLVGMDQFNAMFEDEGTGSWWQQATGEAITGKLKGTTLPEIPSVQMTLSKWFELFPHGKVMQADESFLMVYDSLARFEKGKSTGQLTRTDSLAWQEKSWVVGIQMGKHNKAYDWQDLKEVRIINDVIDQTPIVLVIASDNASFAAFERPGDQIFTISNDTLLAGNIAYDFLGQDLGVPANKLVKIKAYQEFWHSWTTFQPNTTQYFIKEKGN